MFQSHTTVQQTLLITEKDIPPYHGRYPNHRRRKRSNPETATDDKITEQPAPSPEDGEKAAYEGEDTTPATDNDDTSSQKSGKIII